MEGAARWLATGPENQGDRQGQGFDSSAFRQSGARKQTGALRPVANRIEPSGSVSNTGRSANPILSIAGNVFGKDTTVVRPDQGAPVIGGKCQPRGAASGL